MGKLVASIRRVFVRQLEVDPADLSFAEDMWADAGTQPDLVSPSFEEPEPGEDWDQVLAAAKARAEPSAAAPAPCADDEEWDSLLAAARIHVPAPALAPAPARTPIPGPAPRIGRAAARPAPASRAAPAEDDEWEAAIRRARGRTAAVRPQPVDDWADVIRLAKSRAV